MSLLTFSIVIRKKTFFMSPRQWLPEEKIERLGETPEQDSIKISMSGHSKRSVLQAFQRAKQYQKKVESRAYPHIVENDSETDDSDS